MGVTALGYIGISSTDPSAWEAFGPEVLGMPLVDMDEPTVKGLRMDARSYRIAIHPSETDGIAYIGWEVATPGVLDELYERLDAAGREPTRGTPADCRARQVQALVKATDPSGNAIETFFGPPPAPARPFQPTRPISGFVTGNLGLGHVVLRVPDLQRCLDFYTKVMGFGVTDLWGDRMVFMHCNQRHHSLALLQGEPGLHHVMFEAQEMDDVGRTHDVCVAKGLPLYRGLGRHSNDYMFSFYVVGPGGVTIEYGWNGRTIDPADWRVERFEVPSFWGHLAEGDTTPRGAY